MTAKTKLSKTVRDIIKNDILNHANFFGCDLNLELFNMHFGTNLESEKVLNEIGVFYAIERVQKYENHIFGETCTPINALKIANMIVYIVGGWVLNQSKTLSDKSGERLTTKDLKKIKKELLSYIKDSELDITFSALNCYK